MSEPPWTDINEKIDEGIRKAQDDYKEATWAPLLYCPEYLMTVNIFKSLLELTSLSLEENPEALLKAYQQGSHPRGRPKKVPRGNGRVDICLWCRDVDRPRAIIEVKRCAKDWENQALDIIRLAKLLLKYRGLKFGVLASCIHMEVKDNNNTTAQNTIKNKLRKIRQSIEVNLDDQLSFKWASRNPFYSP